MQANNPIIVLFIDDDLDDQEFFDLVVKKMHLDATCIYANDGLYALEKLNSLQFAPHIIFIDINMPRMNGINFLCELKKMPKYKDVPAYMYSTYADNDTIDNCKKLGAAGFIKKHTSITEAKKEFEQIITNLN
jgi:CheY-like chemotaxis protein